MAMNPMQRKANNYLLIGIFGTLIVTGAIIAFLFVQLNNKNQDEKKRIANMKSVYVVSEDIKSGASINGKLEMKSADQTVIPSNAFNIENFKETEEELDDKVMEKLTSKIALNIGTVLTNDMIEREDAKTSADLRKQEYNMIILPSNITNEDYIDIRLQLSNGVDYIVVSKKKVTIPDAEGTLASEYTMSINLTEAERMALASAIVEAYQDIGSILYATTYVDAGMQKSIIPTYIPTDATINVMNANANIEQEAKNALFARYNQNRDIVRNNINSDVAQYAQDRVDNIEAGVQQQITRAREERERYLQALGGY